ncbi:hypothetical protein HY643_03125 [Candidatus Woesearchaeota archaeon]|nr:hypothetical protein [Candidatus Woesearchaeota archaeon]
MRLKKLLLLTPFSFLFLLSEVSAHCPLCTVGAVALAGGATLIGVNQAAIGLFIGAFAASMGWWVSGLIKKKYIPGQRAALVLFSFATTVIPLLKLMDGIKPVYISLIGNYGSLLNRTYILNLFLVGSILGLIVVSLTPWISKKIVNLRNGKLMPFQGVLLTFVLLLIGAVLMQLIL